MTLLRATLPSTLLALLSLLATACGSDPSSAHEFAQSESETNASNGKGEQAGAFDTAPTANPSASTTATTGPCSPSPLNMEIPGNGCDDNGDGSIDEAIETCDADLNAGDAMTFAKALGVCQIAGTDRWGIVSAEYTNGRGGSPSLSQHSMLSKFGNVLKPREGKKLGVIGTSATTEMGGTYGYREVGAPGTPGVVPSPCAIGQSCGSGGFGGNDVINVKLAIKVPANAKGFGIDYNFFTSEWPWYVGSAFNDGFLVHVESKSGSGNIALDAKGGRIDVNNGFFDRCTPNVKLGCAGVQQPGLSACRGGDTELTGTGFAKRDYPDVSLDTPPSSNIPSKACFGLPSLPASTGGATGWLSSQTAVTPGETITVQIAIWNTGDGRLQSVALVDNIHWIAGETTTTTTRPPPVIN